MKFPFAPGSRRTATPWVVVKLVPTVFSSPSASTVTPTSEPAWTAQPSSFSSAPFATAIAGSCPMPWELNWTLATETSFASTESAFLPSLWIMTRPPEVAWPTR